MAVNTSHRRQAAAQARRTPCTVGGKLHSRKPGGKCRHCGNVPEATRKASR